MDRQIIAGPFARSFIVAGVVYVVLLAYLGVNVPDFPHKAGSLLGSCTTPAVLTGIVATYTPIKKSWLAILLVYLGLGLLLFILLGKRYLSF